MCSQMFKKCRNILLRRGDQNPLPAFEELGERLQIAVVCLASEWPQPLLNAKISLIILQQTEVAFNAHTFDYPRLSN
jgi:hypothetical protein